VKTKISLIPKLLSLGAIGTIALLSSNAYGACTDPTIEGAEVSFDGSDCYYKLVNTIDYAAGNQVNGGGVCEGAAGSLGRCELENDVPYKVQRWITQPSWGDFAGGDFLIPAAVRDSTGGSTSSSNNGCADPVIDGNEVSFSGSECYYKLVNTVDFSPGTKVDGGGICEGAGHSLGNCVRK